MIQKIKKNGLAAITFLLCTAVMTSCGKDDDKGKNSSGIPDGTSTFWSDAYRQHQLHGKVKTAIERYSSHFYHYWEYDVNGNLLKDHSRDDRDPSDYTGLTLSYDAQNRLTKVVYGWTSDPEVEVAEFGYDGSHTAYIPTNIYSMGDLRLQKGVSSVKYRREDNEPMIINCTSASGNRVVFEGTAGWLASALGNINRVEVDCSGNYPAHISFKNMGTAHSEAKVEFGTEGMPTRVTYVLPDGEQTVTEYISKGGFLLMTKQYETSDPDDYTLYTYNDQGMLVNERSADGHEKRYTYQYDSKGNWIQKSFEYRTSSSAQWQAGTDVEKRELTYWN